MGSLSLGRVLGVSRTPSIPAIPSTPAPPPVTIPAPVPATGTPAPAAPSQEDINQARVSAILQQKRGLSGTIATSWRGLLNQSATALSRKTLLGE